MNFQKSTLVTSFLKASKDADIDELKSVIQSILKNGISNNDLNSVDNNGRTALSHICTTSLTKVLGVLLRLPGIDVNKADNEANTPLHFAAATGQTEVVTMLTTRSGSLIIDSKNNFGLTPLMKAAVEGHTDCAKRLISACGNTALHLLAKSDNLTCVKIGGFQRVGIVVRKVANTAHPTCWLEQHGDEYHYNSQTPFKTSVVKFKLGEEKEQETPDGRKVLTTFTLDGNTLTQVEKCKKNSVNVRVFSDTELVITLTYGDVKSKRVHKVVE